MIVSIKVPFKAARNGVRKLIVPTEHAKPQYAPDKTLVKALTQAWYWQQQLDAGKFSSVNALAKKHHVHLSRAYRILKLNSLSPKVKRAILDGVQPRTMSLDMLKNPWPEVWTEQLVHFQFGE